MDRAKIIEELEELIEDTDIHELPLDAVNFENALKYADDVGQATGGYITSKIRDEDIENIVNEAVDFAHSKALSRATLTQEIINASHGCGLRAIKPKGKKASRAKNLAKYIVNQIRKLEGDEGISLLGETITSKTATMAMSTVDDVMQASAYALSKAGIEQRITRKLSSSHNHNNPHDPKHTDWCESLAGTYLIGEEPIDVWRRHENCRCTIDYKGDGGSNSWNKTNGIKRTKMTYKHSDGKTVIRKLNASTGKYEVMR